MTRRNVFYLRFLNEADSSRTEACMFHAQNKSLARITWQSQRQLLLPVLPAQTTYFVINTGWRNLKYFVSDLSYKRLIKPETQFSPLGTKVRQSFV